MNKAQIAMLIRIAFVALVITVAVMLINRESPPPPIPVETDDEPTGAPENATIESVPETPPPDAVREQ